MSQTLDFTGFVTYFVFYLSLKNSDLLRVSGDISNLSDDLYNLKVTTTDPIRIMSTVTTKDSDCALSVGIASVYIITIRKRAISNANQRTTKIYTMEGWALTPKTTLISSYNGTNSADFTPTFSVDTSSWTFGVTVSCTNGYECSIYALRLM